MAKRPEQGPRLSLTFTMAPYFADEDEMREAVARNRAMQAHWHADQGNFAPLLELLRDDETPLSRQARELAADIIEGKHKRSEGAQADYRNAMKRWEAARLFVVLTAHPKLKLKSKVAKGKLADFYGCGDGTVAEWLSSERARLGPKTWAEMEQQAAEAFDFLCWAFPDNKELQQLLGVTGNSAVGR